MLTTSAVLAAGGTPTIVVDSTADNLTGGDGQCTLREALQNANADADTTSGDCAMGVGADVIGLPAGTFTLTIAGAGENANATGDLDIADADGLTILGAGSSQTIIEAGTSDPTVSCADCIDRVFDVPTSSDLCLAGLTIRHGFLNNSESGAGLRYRPGSGASGAIEIDDVVFASNSGGGDDDGGAIHIQSCATLDITNSAFTDNELRLTGSPAVGGAADVRCGIVNISATSFTGNEVSQLGGGIAIRGAGTGALVGVTITGNAVVNAPTGSASSQVARNGGLRVESGRTITIQNSVVQGNTDLDTATMVDDCEEVGTITPIGGNTMGIGCPQDPPELQAGDLDDDGINDLTDTCFGNFGDLNDSGSTNVADAICLLLTASAEAASAAPPACLAPAAGLRSDMNCSGDTTVGDVQIVVAYALDLPLGPLDSDGNNCVDTCDMPFAHTIAIDGVNDFTPGEAQATNTDDFVHYVTWDETHLYLGYEEPFDAPDDWRVWYFSGEPGTTQGVQYIGQEPTLPLRARFQFQWNSNTTEALLREWNGTAWGAPVPVTTKAQGAGFGEVALPFTDVPLLPDFQMHVSVIREASGAERTAATTPPESIEVPSGVFDNGPFNPTYAHSVRLDLRAPPHAPRTEYSHEIRVDLVPDFLPSETLTSNTAGWTHYLAWDDDHYYLGWEQPFGFAQDWRTWYFGGDNGTTQGVTYNTQSPILPFDARYHVQWRTDSPSEVRLIEWNGSAWVTVKSLAAQAAYSATYGEIAIDRADLNAVGSDIDLHISVLREKPFEESTWAATPETSFSVPGGVFDINTNPYDPDFGASLLVGGGSTYDVSVQ